MINEDRPIHEPWWREWDMPDNQRRIAAIDKLYMSLAGSIHQNRQPGDQDWLAFQFLLADAMTSADRDAIAAAHAAVASLRSTMDDSERWEIWRGALNSIQDILFLVDFSLAGEPL